MKPKIIHVLCEGQTEQGFVDKVLKHYLLENRSNGIIAVKSVIVGTGKDSRGGLSTYAHVKNDLDTMMLHNPDNEHERHLFTTMFDLYALPNDFPEYATAMKIADRYLCVTALEKAHANDVGSDRFIPYIQLHEFEALVFCGIKYLTDLYPECKQQCRKLEADLANVGNPELINNSPATAPSKRLINAIENGPKTRYKYNKPRTGKYVTIKVGIPELRTRCPHFNEWIQKLQDS